MEEWRLVRWKETLWYNGLRSVIAALIWTTIMSMTSEPAPTTAQAAELFLGLSIVCIPIALFFRLLSYIPFLGLAALIAAIYVGIADPFIYLLHKIAPATVPLEAPPIFSAQSWIFVMSPFTKY